MKRIQLVFISVMIFSNAYSQDFITLKKIVKDSKTQDRISYASIGIKGKSIGTYADANGYFELHFSTGVLADSLSISALGYSVYKAKLSDLLNDHSEFILLKSQPILLKETLILSKKDSAGIILKKAVSNIKKNFSQTPYNAEAYYSEFIQENQSFARAIEAALDLYNDGKSYSLISFKSSYQIKIKEVRKSDDYLKNPERYNNANNLNLALTLCSVYSLTSYLNYNKYRIDNISYLNGELVYKITSLDSKEYFIIGQNNYAIYKIYHVIDLPHSDSNKKNNSFKMDKHTRISLDKVIMSVDFFRFKNNLFPKLIEFSYGTTNYDKEMKNKGIESIRFARILFNNIILNDIKEIPKSEQIDVYKDMFNIEYKFNKAFWDKFNIITDTSISEKVYQDIFKNKIKND